VDVERLCRGRHRHDLPELLGGVDRRRAQTEETLEAMMSASGWIILYPSIEPGGPLRVVANRGLGHRPASVAAHLCLSTRRDPARFWSRKMAERVASWVRRDLGRPIIVEYELWRRLPRAAQ
jgi:hypothetical protein